MDISVDKHSLVDISQLADILVGWFEPQQCYVVALSGGVDSAVVACAAVRSRVPVEAVTGHGPSLSQRELEDAVKVAQWLGLPHRLLESNEQLDPHYRRNDPRRCFHCKSHLFAVITHSCPKRIILTGTNLDDLADYRPGLEAARLAQVRSPLAELHITKSRVRELAHYWNLPVAEKPASPCLASRIAFGVEVTPERLRRIEVAEVILRELLQIEDCRVRLHESDLIRIEVAAEQLIRLCRDELRLTLLDRLKSLGFHFVTVDLAGQRSGSLNAVIPIQLPKAVR